jgi:phospholipase/carboxylesterase
MSNLDYQHRAAAGDPQGLLVLHHGRGSNQHDLIGLADVIDPQCRFEVFTPAGPLVLDGWPGRHWYVVPRVGYPDPRTFAESYRRLGEFHDWLWQQTGIGPERTILGGFSMGAVMSYATGLGPGRPQPAGIMALSGFVPTVEGWTPELASRAGLPVFTAHGRNDPVISVEFARHATALLKAAGLDVEYRESDSAHNIDPADIGPLIDWLDRTLGNDSRENDQQA